VQPDLRQQPSQRFRNFELRGTNRGRAPRCCLREPIAVRVKL